ncbi:MAG TPA: alpha/beta hydrolase [Terriglobales bacterium]|jgi:monoterpene epsilon-lactone hydrolase|nr:alpha/beta hydrolase [Terriglobales bacterium]
MIRFQPPILTFLLFGLGFLFGCTKDRIPIPATDTSVVDEHGTLHVTRIVPVPETVSPDGQKFMSLPRSDEDDHISLQQNRSNAEHWQETLARDMQSMYPATLARDTIAGVPVRVITPPSIPAEKRDRVLLNVHGGGFQADWGSVAETVPIASLTQTKVVAVLYRLAPEHPFPAAVDDTIAVYQELLKTHKPQNIVLYGTSAGAVLTGEVAVRLKQLGLPLPAALGIFSGSGDLARKGDSLAIFGLWGLSGPLFPPTKSAQPDPYLGSTDPRDPVLSPIFANLKGLPPTLFLTSERDLLLSGTVNLHRAFRNAGVESELVVFDGLHHAFWNEFRMPESVEADHTIAEFFSRHLGK